MNEILDQNPNESIPKSELFSKLALFSIISSILVIIGKNAYILYENRDSEEINPEVVSFDTEFFLMYLLLALFFISFITLIISISTEKLNKFNTITILIYILFFIYIFIRNKMATS
jgi:hypothetical protein